MTTKADLKPPPLKHAGTIVDAPKPRPAPVPWADRVAAYDRIAPTLKALASAAAPNRWTREEWIEHYRGILAGTHREAQPWAFQFAREALQVLGYRERTASVREPGEDDEPTAETAWTEPADGDAGDITKRARRAPPAPETEALPLGIARDALEEEFRRPPPAC